MADALGLMKTIKRGALDAVDESKPVNVCFGTVTSASPLTVNVEQKINLGAKQLTVAKHLTDYSVRVDDPEEGVRTMTFYNALEAGDRVILLRQQGGQKYIIVDKVG